MHPGQLYICHLQSYGFRVKVPGIGTSRGPGPGEARWHAQPDLAVGYVKARQRLIHVPHLRTRQKRDTLFAEKQSNLHPHVEERGFIKRFISIS
ncbi:hypothetical protein CEXT_736321 [Caerostris extrusa]|uniref:Uncharacterized protein n=1 Tax=Caerostris extrusa TaxID=172846 RepID=A0AAV4Q9R2_CAEEX|nr:hypothetical protein CEXT_736321 [Caerostris extrusa]